MIPQDTPAADAADSARMVADRLNEMAQEIFQLTPLLHQASLDAAAVTLANLARASEAIADALMAGEPASAIILQPNPPRA